MHIEITIPSLNEEFTLEKNVKEVLAFFEEFEKKNNLTASICIADNGSTDKTARIAKSLESEFNGKVRYLYIPMQGIGIALKTSWSSSNADIVGYMDLDLATDLNHLKDVVDSITASADVVVGTRLAKDSKVIGRSLFREIVSRVFNCILKILLNVKFSDAMCGFKFMPREIAEKLIATKIMSDSWFFGTEILLIAQWLSLKIVEIPVRWTDTPATKVKVFHLAVMYIKRMFELRKIRKSFIHK